MEKAAEDGIVLSSCPKRGTKQDNIGMLFKMLAQQFFS